MLTAQFLIIGVAVMLIGITGFSIYTAFGSPSKQLDDPYEMHED